MASRNMWSILLIGLLVQLLSLDYTTQAQIFNGGEMVAPAGSNFIASDIPPTFVATTEAPKSSTSSDGKSSSTSASNSTTTTPPPAPTTPPPPIPVQPYTTLGPGVFPITPAAPLPLPTTPALFPQNISSCSTCYGMFPTLSRCNVIANTNTFPITPNTTYESLLPFLKCICTYKVLDAYPYCIDCFTKTQQLAQLNVLQANHLENYMDAIHQLCGVTYNGNKASDSAMRLSKVSAVTQSGLTLVALLVSTVLAGMAI
ncbi:hypothetical protein BGZ52_005693 [Haplosporangium bisporale]|nr:hypothetical protein BGZ52_005693 [Haplosporangium bisporale]KAF9217989.1 hypothetical protein BGZ59_005760 [Podila verticillata]KFH69149.1 hypothetical protein MVEG_05950 [Podila verticillata NRRL 6337]